MSNQSPDYTVMQLNNVDLKDVRKALDNYYNTGEVAAAIMYAENLLTEVQNLRELLKESNVQSIP
jgi:hypothetical protein